MDIGKWCFVVGLTLSCSACSGKAPTKEQLLASANEALAGNQYITAERHYREVLRLSPNEPTAVRQLAILYATQGQLPQAYPLLEKSAESKPDDIEVQLKLGQLRLILGDRARAREIATGLLEKSPGSEEALILFAGTAFSADEIADTTRSIERLRERDQGRAGYNLALGMLDLRKQQPQQAEKQFKEALSLDGKSINAFLALGELYWIRGDARAAATALKTAADLDTAHLSAPLRYADFLLKTGSVDEARSLLEELNRKNPDYLPPRVALMNLACVQKRDESCTTRVKKILAQDPNNYDAVLQDGILSLEKGETGTAIRNFEYLSNTFQRNPQVRYQLALAYLQSAKSANEINRRNIIDAAEARLSEAIRLSPLVEPAVLLFADLKIKKGAAAAAVDPLLRLIQQNPKVPQAHYLLALAYLGQQQSDKALAVYRHMADLFPQDAQPHFLIGSVRLIQGQRAEARQAFQNALSISSGYLPAVEMLVDLDIGEKQYSSGMDLVQKQIAQHSDRASLWALRAKLYFAQQDLTKAEGDLLKAIELDSNLTPAYLLLAQLYVASNREQEAIKRLNVATEKSKSSSTLLLLASIYERTKDYSSARDTYERLVSVEPNNAIALNNLAVIYSEHFQQLDKALDLARKARDLAPNEPHLTDTLGWIMFKKGDYSNALRTLHESANKLPNEAEVQFHAGMAHYMTGDEVSARLALQKAIDTKAEFSGRDEARRRLSILAIDGKVADPGTRASLDSYLRENPSDPVALVKLAAFRERDGATDQAAKAYEKIISEYPLFAPALRRLAILYSQRSTDTSKAFDLATKARQAYPDDPEVSKALGILNYRRELYPRSAELLKEATAKLKDDAEVHYFLGEAHRQLKQWNECASILGRAIALGLPAQLGENARRGVADCKEAIQ